MTEACIPYGAYWCTPFARWQGALAHLHAVEFAAWVTRRALADRHRRAGVRSPEAGIQPLGDSSARQ